MGYAAVTGNVLSAESALLAGVLFLWQFPFFFAGGINREGYAAGGHKMVPCADPTGMRMLPLYVVTQQLSYLCR